MMSDGIAHRNDVSATWNTQRVPALGHNGGMEIEVLHIDECPNWEDAGKTLAEVIEELELTNVTLRFTLIRTSKDATEHRFAGSPTILIDGVDAVPGVDPTTDRACRIYRDGPRTAGIPTRETLRAAILSRLDSSAS